MKKKHDRAVYARHLDKKVTRKLVLGQDVKIETVPADWILNEGLLVPLHLKENLSVHKQRTYTVEEKMLIN